MGTIRAVYEQQKYMYDNRTHSVPDRIVSVSQPFVRPIVRGKAGKPVEFGAKLDISVVDGWTRLECCSFDAYNEAGNLREMAERFRAREGHYPSRILADKIYRNRENLSYCKAHGIRLSGPALGRPKKGETRDKAQDYRDECERVEVERRFSLAKRKCGMDRLFHMDMQKDTIVHTISSVMLDPTNKNIPITIDKITSVAVNGKDLGFDGYLDIGLYDTMEDLLVNFIGALTFSIFGYFYIKRRGKGRIAKAFIPTITTESKELDAPHEQSQAQDRSEAPEARGG